MKSTRSGYRLLLNTPKAFAEATRINTTIYSTLRPRFMSGISANWQRQFIPYPVRWLSDDRSDQEVSSDSGRRQSHSKLDEEWERAWQGENAEAQFDAGLRAAIEGRWDLLDGLGKNINELKNASGQFFLSAFVATQDLEKVDACLNQSLVNHFSATQLTEALTTAICSKRIDLILPLLIAGSDINGKGLAGRTPLFTAIEGNDRHVLANLLRNSPDITVGCETQLDLNLPPTREGRAIDVNQTALFSPLAYAIKCGSSDAIDLFPKEKGSAALAKAMVPGIGNALHVAIAYKQTPILRYLFKHYTEACTHLMASESGDGYTPLALAAYLGDVFALEILYKRGANLNSRDTLQRHPIDWAIAGKQIKMIEMLAYMGADLQLASSHRDAKPHLRGLVYKLQRRQQDREGEPAYQGLQPLNLALQGGGVKGTGHIGALQVLDEERILERILRVSGTSAAAIVASLLATNNSVTELDQHLRKTNLSSFLEMDPEKLQPFVTGATKLSSWLEGRKYATSSLNLSSIVVARLMNEPGLTDVSGIERWVDELIESKTKIKGLTFGELKQMVDRDTPGYRHLTVSVTQMSPEVKPLRITSEDEEWGDTTIPSAVAASCAYPILFKPARLRYKRQGRIDKQDHRSFIDGGLLDNLPLTVWDKTDSKWNTMGIALAGQPEKPSDPPQDAVQVFERLFKAYSNAEAIIREYAEDRRIFTIDCGKVKTFDTDISKQEQDALIVQGRRAAVQFLQLNPWTPSTSHDGPPVNVPSNLPGLPEPIYPIRELFTEVQKPITAHLRYRSLHSIYGDRLPTLSYTIYGLPGTETDVLASRLASETVHLTSFTYWIDARTKQSREEGYRNLLEHLDIQPGDNIEHSLIEHLERFPFSKPWMLVYSNLDEKIALPSRGGVVLKTSTQTSLSKDLVKVPSIWEYLEHKSSFNEKGITLSDSAAEALKATQEGAWKQFVARLDKEQPGSTDLLLFLSMDTQANWAWNDIYSWMKHQNPFISTTVLTEQLHTLIDRFSQMGLIRSQGEAVQINRIIPPELIYQIIPESKERTGEMVQYLDRQIPPADQKIDDPIFDGEVSVDRWSKSVARLLDSSLFDIEPNRKIALHFKVGNINFQRFGYSQAKPHFCAAFDLLARTPQPSRAATEGAVAMWRGLTWFLLSLVEQQNLAGFFSKQLADVGNTDWFGGYNSTNSARYADAINLAIQSQDNALPEVDYLQAVAVLLTPPEHFWQQKPLQEQREAVFKSADKLHQLHSINISLDKLLSIVTEHLKELLSSDLQDSQKCKTYSRQATELINAMHAEKFGEKIAVSGHPIAQGLLAVCYRFGFGVEKDFAKAVNLLEPIATRGNATAQQMLGQMYHFGQGVDKDLEAAIRYYKLAADQNDVTAQYNLAGLYKEGVGVEQDLSRAAKLYLHAADQGHGAAQHNLALCYQYGHGVPQSWEKAIQYYSLAGAQGRADSLNNLATCHLLGKGTKKNLKHAAFLFKVAADLGDAYAQLSLGVAYKQGLGVEANASEAVRLFELAAEQGEVGALHNLGCCYLEGSGVDKDPTRAFALFTKAASAGYLDAQLNLAMCYYQGLGVPKNVQTAIDLYKTLAEQGDESAQHNLVSIGACYFSGNGVEIDPNKAVELYKFAAEQGSAPGQVNLALCLLRGAGIRKDPIEAVRLLTLATDQGDVEAARILGVCYEKGEGVEADSKKAVQLYHWAADGGDKGAKRLLDALDAHVRSRAAEFVQDLENEAAQGDANAQLKLGKVYDEGVLVEKDPEKAYEYFKLAADQDNPHALYELGQCYLEGKGTSTNPEEVVRLFKLSAEGGVPEAQFHLGTYYQFGGVVEKSWIKAVEYHKKAANQGYAQAQHALAYIYGEGGHGIERNEVMATKFLKLAADNGIAASRYTLGARYSAGRGELEVDVTKAAKLYKLAADQGHAEAQLVLGLYYRTGLGVERDLNKALRYIRLSADQAHNLAQVTLASFYAQGLGVQQDYKEAARLCSLAAAQGNPFGQLELALYYKNGWGVERDPETAITLYMASANQGNLTAKFEAAKCYLEGIGATPNRQKAMDLLREASSAGYQQAQDLLKQLEIDNK